MKEKIQRIRPDKILIYALLFWVIMYLIAPVSIINKNSFSSGLYLFMGFVAFWLGTHTNIRVGRSMTKLNYNKLNNLYKLSLKISVLAIVLKYYDWFFIRGFSVGLSNFGDNIMALEDHSTSLISFGAASIGAVPYLPVTLNILFPSLNNTKNKVIAIILFLMTAIGSVVTGSRFALINPLLYLTFVYLATKCEKIITTKNIFLVLVSLFFFLIFSATLFIQRLEVQNKDVFDSTNSITGGYSDKVPASKSYQAFMHDYQEKPFLIGPAFAFVQSTQYAIHGVFEFPECKMYIDDRDRCTYGGASFLIFNKVLNLIGLGINQKYIEESNARPGIWSTFFYEWYLDFKWLGIPLVFFLGLLFRYWWNLVYYRGNIFYLPLVAMASIILVLVFQLNCLAGSGMYGLVDFVIFAIYATKRS